MITSYKTLIVRFNSPIAVIDEVFNDAAYLGVGNLKDGFAVSERPVSNEITKKTTIITNENNIECVREWLEHNTTFAVIAEY